MALLGNLVVNLLGDTKGLESSLTKAQKKMQAVAGNLTKIGTRMSALVTLPLAGIGVAALKVASDAEEMESKFNVVFGELAGEAKTWADEFGDSVGRSTASVMGWMAALQDTFVPLGFARAEGAELSKTLAKLTVDMASFNNESEANVIRDLQSALVGNHETVRKYGVIITQATLDQELMNMGIRDGIQAATEQQKVQARMNIIIAGTADAQGDAIRTADSFANRMRALKESVKDLLIGLGNQLIPTISTLVEKITGAVEWFSNLDDRWKKMIGIFAGTLAAAGPLMLGLGGLISIIGKIGPAIKAIGPAINAIFATPPVGLILVGIAAVVAGTILLIKHWDKVRLFFQKLYVRIAEFFEGVVNWVLKSPDWVAYLLAAFVPFIGLPMLLIKNWESFSDGMERVINAIVKFGIDAFNVMKVGILEAMLGILTGIRWVLQKLGKETPKLDSAIGSLNQKIIDTKNAAENLEYPTVELTDVFSKLADGADELRKSIKELEEKEGELEEGQKKLTEDTTENTDAIKEEKEWLEYLAEAEKAYAESVHFSGEQLEFYNEMLESRRKSEEWLKSPIENIVEVVDRVNDKWLEYYRLMKDYVTPVSVDVADSSDKINRGFAGLLKTQEELAAYTESAFADSMIMGFDAIMTGSKSLKEGLKDMIASFLEALGKLYFTQFLANIVIPFMQGRALKFMAASIAAYAGAAIVRSLAQGGEFVTNGPTPIMVGDNPGGRELVQVTPLSSPNINGPKIVYLAPISIDIDSGPIYKGLLKASEDGFALIDENAIVRQ